MPFNRPTLIEIENRVEAQAKDAVNITSLLRRSFLSIFSRVIAGVAHLWHGHLEYNSRQFLPTDMDEENLIKYGGIRGIQRKVATAGIYEAVIIGPVGATVPANTTFKRTDNFEYFTEAAVIVDAQGEGVINLIATEAGSISELAVGDILEILNPIAGFESEAEITLAIIEPSDIESVEDYRARIIERERNPISGGTATDYIQWAKEVGGVTRAWSLPANLGLGTVGVSFVQDGETPITPSAAKVLEVQEYIDDRRPVTANVTVFAPLLFPIDMTIKIKPNSLEVQDAVIGQLKDLILRDSNLEGAYIGPGQTFDGKVLISRINEAISLAADEQDHLIVDINSATPADIVPPTNHLVVLGNITWQPLA